MVQEEGLRQVQGALQFELGELAAIGLASGEPLEQPESLFLVTLRLNGCQRVSVERRLGHFEREAVTGSRRAVEAEVGQPQTLLLCVRLYKFQELLLPVFLK